MRVLMLSLLALILLPAQAFAETQVGKISALKGMVLRTSQGSDLKVEAVAGGPVMLGDTFETQAGAGTRLTFNDGTDITIGEKGTLVVDEFVYDPENPAQSKTRYSILHTAFVYLSGKHENDAHADAAVRVDFGSIGIRGTTLYRGMRDGQCWIYLKEGAVTVMNDGGSVDLTPGMLTRMSAKTTSPSVPIAFNSADLAWIEDATRLK